MSNLSMKNSCTSAALCAAGFLLVQLFQGKKIISIMEWLLVLV